ncbi:hypothetical protein PsorP6_016193 [Peronosclerospora sorghi]|uniref:Uncharacterized protein n=1 Tax=Peronosclerospora sorghi TaxID=230839 RepID=A0ACC0VL33_9STRA|nr:hypothetical protein PsorP6_016193 [Peronosclerospora sorghi]
MRQCLPLLVASFALVTPALSEVTSTQDVRKLIGEEMNVSANSYTPGEVSAEDEERSTARGLLLWEQYRSIVQ